MQRDITQEAGLRTISTTIAFQVSEKLDEVIGAVVSLQATLVGNMNKK